MIAGLVSIAALGALNLLGPAVAEMFTQAAAPF